MVKAHAGKVSAARQIGDGGAVITLGATDRSVHEGEDKDAMAMPPKTQTT